MSTDMKINVAGKVRNLPDCKREALLPVFEAVVNSIHGIEDAGRMDEGYVEVRITRGHQQAMFADEGDHGQLESFEIIDNGIGFDDANFESFNTSDSPHKIDRGCKGIGRFLWLKAFTSAEIDSVYSNGNGKLLRRVFSFNTTKGIEPKQNVPADESECKTSVRLIGFRREYRDSPSAYRTTEKIAQRILEHCLAYYISGKAPHIVVVDPDCDKRIDLNGLFDEIKSTVQTQELPIKGETFTIHHMRMFGTHANIHELVYCANGRGVKSVPLQKMLGTKTQFDENDRKFFYTAYITSDYLDKRVDSCHQSFNIPDGDSDLQFEPINMEVIESSMINHIKDYLADILQLIAKRKLELVDDYVATESPMLRAVLKYCPEVLDDIEVNSSKERICQVLYSYKGKVEHDIRSRTEKLLRSQVMSIDEISQESKYCVEKLDVLQKDDLAGYVLRRKMIINLLEQKLELNTEGKYANEDIIHDIVFPRYTDSDELNYQDHNLWLIDEVLAFHVFACSDKDFRQISTSTSQDRPDILVFSEIGEDRVASAVSFVEFKKPQRERHNEDPTEQLYDYVGEVTSKGEFKLKNGRVVGVNDQTRFYCYAICDLTAQIRKFVLRQDYAILRGEFGYYKYSRNLNAHTTVIDYRKLVVDANRRHKAFFTKLGI